MLKAFLVNFWGFSGRFMKISLRTKLVISFLAVISICGLIAILVAMQLIGKGIINQAQDKVKHDLNSAREIYREEVEHIRDVVRFTALRFFIKDAISANDADRLLREMDNIRRAESLDILTLTDEKGRVIVRTRNPTVAEGCRVDDEGDSAEAMSPREGGLVSCVLSDGQVIAGTEIVSREELLKEATDLAEQAYIKFVPTPKAKPSPETEQTSGMMIKAAAPVLGYDGRLLGVLYGGNLLNRNYKVVDKVKDTVYQGIRYKGKDIGTVTIFQGDMRVSTNVKKEDGGRAIGTRVSQEVDEQVLVKGMPWIDRAFVVNNWYISAYEPIKDIKGKIIGILYVGVLEEKFTDMNKRATAIFLGIMFAGMVMALVVSSFLAKGLLHPIRDLVSASHEWAKGNLDYRTKITGSSEITELAETFNFMASSLKERDEKLKEYASQQIMKSERLATLGQLAAGVAHEINNPLGAILMYTHLALEDLKENNVMRKNLEKVTMEASRCRDIVRGLLDFARQSEPKMEESDINRILERTLGLVENQALFHNVNINKIFSTSLPKVLVDVGQMQQVFTNIVLNAAEAMEGKGELKIATRLTDDNGHIEIEFTDTGCGISPENREKIFDPFFTTKQVGHGTGLGLAISYGIIARHKGTIEVKSELNKGTTFIIKLPINRKENLNVQPS